MTDSQNKQQIIDNTDLPEGAPLLLTAFLAILYPDLDTEKVKVLLQERKNNGEITGEQYEKSLECLEIFERKFNNAKN